MSKLITTLMGVLIMAPSAYAYGIVGRHEIGPDKCEIEFLAMDDQIYTFYQFCSTGEQYVEPTKHSTCWSDDSIPYVQ